MAEYILKLDNITKRYKNKNALEKISLSFEKGKIYGLIGQNGAGKTTLLRILTGACRPSEGNIMLSDLSEERPATEKELNAFRGKMGSLIDSPAYAGSMTAWDNMKLQDAVCGQNDETYLADLLSLVHLRDTGKKRVKDFSLGMKQRLGIAKALVNKPDFLLLDEPANGLDPLGIIEIRSLLKEISQKYGITIVVSSHFLSELHQLAGEYIFIERGHLLQTVNSEALNRYIEERGISLEEYFVNLIEGREKEYADKM